MRSELPLRCCCGRVHGIATRVAPSSGFRFVCYCTHCQAFARFLERPNVLDAAGGTDIVQLPPARVRLIAGAEHMRSLCLSDKGVLRWYTACCRTPVANSAANARFPLIAVIHSFIDQDVDPRLRQDALGPPRCRIFERSATGPLPRNAPPPPALAVLALRASMMLRWWARGLARPSPVFDARTGAPLAAPQVIRPA